MQPNRLREKLHQGRTVIGLCNMYPAAGIIEGMCPGYDFVWIDGQHGQMSYDSVLHAAMAATAAEVEAFIRVPGHESGVLGTFADIDPAAIMVPMVDTAEQARGIVRGLRFPPLGDRSYGGRRVIDRNGRHYYRERELLVVAQTETLDGVRNAPEIIGCDGIDMLFFGPDDMKVRLGIPINTPTTESAQLRQAMLDTAVAARNAGKFCGCIAPDAATAKLVTEMGYQLLVAGGDVAFLRSAAAQRLDAIGTAIAASTQDAATATGADVH